MHRSLGPFRVFYADWNFVFFKITLSPYFTLNHNSTSAKQQGRLMAGQLPLPLMLQRRPYPNVRKPLTVTATKEIGAKWRPLTAIFPRKGRNVMPKSRNFTPKGHTFASTGAQFCCGEGLIFASKFKVKFTPKWGIFVSESAQFRSKNVVLPQKGRNLSSQWCNLASKGNLFASKKGAISPRTECKCVPKG